MSGSGLTVGVEILGLGQYAPVRLVRNEEIEEQLGIDRPLRSSLIVSVRIRPAVRILPEAARGFFTRIRTQMPSYGGSAPRCSSSRPTFSCDESIFKKEQAQCCFLTQPERFYLAQVGEIVGFLPPMSGRMGPVTILSRLRRVLARSPSGLAFLGRTLS